MGKGKSLSVEEKSKIEAYKQSGLSISEISKKIGRSRKVISVFLRNKSGYGKNYKGGNNRKIPNTEKRAILREASNSHDTAAKIKANVGAKVTVRTIQRMIKDASLQFDFAMQKIVTTQFRWSQEVKNVPKVRKVPKTAAQRAHEYRERKRVREMTFKKTAKTAAERVRAYRERKKALKNAINQQLIIDKTISHIDREVSQGAINVGTSKAGSRQCGARKRPYEPVVEPPSTSGSLNSGEEMSLNRICRTCDVVSDSTKFAKLNSCPLKYGGKMLLDLLKEVTQIDIEMEYTENFPQLICSNCVRKLKNAYNFIIRARGKHTEKMNFLNGNNRKCLPQVPMEVCTEPIIDIKKEEDSYKDSTIQNEYNYNESLSPLVKNEALENSHDEIVGSDELVELPSYKINQPTISKNEEILSRTECLQEIPIKVFTEQSNELIIKEEPCEFESGNEGNDDESLDALVMNGIVKNRDDHNKNLGPKCEL